MDPGNRVGGFPLAWVLYRRAGRFRRFNLMLPDAIDLMSRALRAGHALPSALSMVADEISDPLGPEFRRTADELNYGLPFREALLNLERRFPVRDLRFLVTAILVQKESGGNLIALLDKSAAVLRSRIHLAQKVRIFTAQGRLTGVILMALPFICFIALNLVSPGYTRPLFENEIGRKMIYGTIGEPGDRVVPDSADHSDQGLNMTSLFIAIFAGLALLGCECPGDSCCRGRTVADRGKACRIAGAIPAGTGPDTRLATCFSLLTQPLAPFRDWLKSRDDELAYRLGVAGLSKTRRCRYISERQAAGPGGWRTARYVYRTRQHASL